MVRLQVAATALLGMAVVMATAGERDIVEVGLSMAERHCSTCHAIRKGEESPHKDAPPFTALAATWPMEKLADAFREGIMAGHADMPFFVLEEGEIAALVEYFYLLAPGGAALGNAGTDN